MQITLNDQLVAQPQARSNDISYSITGTAHSQHPPENGHQYKIIQGTPQSSLSNRGFVGLLSHCYSQHLPVAIAPHDLWIVIMSEITKEVSSHSEEYRSLFTTSDTKETISVPSGSMTEMPMGVLSKALQEKVLFDSSILFQNFSTETPIITETIQAIFCDMASPYYNYMMFCCGIPSIELRGTTEDWQKLLQGFKSIEQTFETDTITQYFNKTAPVLEQFLKASQGEVNLDFWKDIYTQQNVGSGGDLTISGWITKLFVTEHSFAKITHFTNNKGVVKYKQAQTNEEFVAIYGGFDAKPNAQGFLELEYSKFIVQQVAK